MRQTEALVRRLLQGESMESSSTEKDQDTVNLERELTDRIGAPVAISHGASGKGQVVIRYSSLDELDGILSHLR